MTMKLHQFILLVAFTASSISGQKLDVDPPVDYLYVPDGGSQSMSCSTKKGDVSWVRPVGSSEAQTTTSASSASITLTSFNATTDSGKYICVQKDAGRQITNFTINVVGVMEEKHNQKFEYDQELEPLVCDIKFAVKGTNSKSEADWYKVVDNDDVDVKSLEEPNRFEVSTENLTIKEAKRSDAGLYKAVYKINDKYNYTCEVELTANPLVISFEKSKNLIEEDKLELKCDVLGYPRAVVTWYKDGLKLNGSRITLGPYKGYQNAHLVIAKVDFDDAGDYNCTAFSEELNKQDFKVITVRVKDKLAALWPFLGIVGEVLVLCTIIFIYEKRRNKQAEQAENDAKEIDATEKKGNVRNRRNQK